MNRGHFYVRVIFSILGILSSVFCGIAFSNLQKLDKKDEKN